MGCREWHAYYRIYKVIILFNDHATGIIIILKNCKEREREKREHRSVFCYCSLKLLAGLNFTLFWSVEDAWRNALNSIYMRRQERIERQVLPTPWFPFLYIYIIGIELEPCCECEREDRLRLIKRNADKQSDNNDDKVLHISLRSWLRAEPFCLKRDDSLFILWIRLGTDCYGVMTKHKSLNRIHHHHYKNLLKELY